MLHVIEGSCLENVVVKSKGLKLLSALKAYIDQTRLGMLFLLCFVFFQFLTLSALLHTSVSLPACERLSWKCKLSSQHALALVALF